MFKTHLTPEACKRNFGNSVIADKEKVDCGKSVDDKKMNIQLEAEASLVYARENYACKAQISGGVFTFEDVMDDTTCQGQVKVKCSL